MVRSLADMVSPPLRLHLRCARFVFRAPLPPAGAGRSPGKPRGFFSGSLPLGRNEREGCCEASLTPLFRTGRFGAVASFLGQGGSIKSGSPAPAGRTSLAVTREHRPRLPGPVRGFHHHLGPLGQSFRGWCRFSGRTRIKGFPDWMARDASIAVFHCRYFSPKRAMTTSAFRIQIRVPQAVELRGRLVAADLPG